MSKLETLRDGLLDELRDLFSAENQLLKALPKMEKKATDAKLKQALGSHLEETKGQVERLQKIAGILGEKLTGKTCKAMQGLVEEGSEVIEEESDNDALLDVLLVGAARRVEHYEMAAYETAHAMAKELGEDEVVQLLSETLSEEVAADQKLMSLLERTILREANSIDDESEVDDDEDEPEERTPTKKAKSSGFVQKMSIVAFLALTATVSTQAMAETSAVKNEQQAAAHKVDNTGRNARDVNDNRKTADEQKLGGDELQLLAQIRKNIVANSNLSTNAHNVKILVDNGTVTLRGPVNSAEERNWIQQEAARTAAGYKVDNQLEVASN